MLAFHVPAVSVPTPVIPVYEPEILAVSIVPDVIWVAAIAILVSSKEVN